MAVFGTLSVIRTQLADLPGLGRALDYVECCLTEGTVEYGRARAVAVGETQRVELGEGVFVLEQAYVAKRREEGRWEAHSAYLDIQVILAGKERMELMDTSGLEVEEDLRTERDLIFFKAKDGGSVLEAGEGFIAVFFPPDAHKPSLEAGAGAGVVKVWKAVVKVPVGLVV